MVCLYVFLTILMDKKQQVYIKIYIQIHHHSSLNFYFEIMKIHQVFIHQMEPSLAS